MSPRAVCNVVYAHLVAGADADARARFDEELYAPAGGWVAADSRFFARLDQEGTG